MTETVPVPVPTQKKRARRSDADRKLILAAKIKAIELKGEIADKKALNELAEVVASISKRRPQQPTIGQAATLIAQAANAITAVLPQ